MKLSSQEDYNKFVKKVFTETFDSMTFNPLMMAFAMMDEFDDEESRLFSAIAIAWFVLYYRGVMPNGSDANDKVRWVAHDVVNYTNLGMRMDRDMATAEY